MIDIEILEEQFDKGIKKTWFKSRVLEKINELRAILNMSLRSQPMENKQYDGQVVEKLESIDFSPLDTSIPGAHNLMKNTVLTFAGIGFSRAEDVLDNSNNNNNLNDHYEHDLIGNTADI